MNTDFLYEERLTSNKTEALFLSCCIFFFYSINYRTLVIRLTPESLVLKFGIFIWTIPLDNIAGGSLDEIPALMKYGGAGIHFMMVGKRYRASFNFLEYPRLVIELERKAGPVREISFSTRLPEELLKLMQETAAARRLW
jgi:hypothetical protein